MRTSDATRPQSLSGWTRTASANLFASDSLPFQSRLVFLHHLVLPYSSGWTSATTSSLSSPRGNLNGRRNTEEYNSVCSMDQLYSLLYCYFTSTKNTHLSKWPLLAETKRPCWWVSIETVSGNKKIWLNFGWRATCVLCPSYTVFGPLGAVIHALSGSLGSVTDTLRGSYFLRIAGPAAWNEQECNQERSESPFLCPAMQKPKPPINLILFCLIYRLNFIHIHIYTYLNIHI